MVDRAKRTVAATCAVSVALLAGAAAAQSQYSSIAVFGDSLSDPGNIPKFFGVNYPAPPYYQNQFSNGPVYAKYLDRLFGISAPLQDYAIGGARTGMGNIGGLPGNPAIGLPNAGIDGELSYYLAGDPRPAADSLFIVWGGANDYFGDLPVVEALGLSGAALKSYLTGPTGPVTQTVANLVTDINRLARIGVKNFVVPNLPILGDTPDYSGNATISADATALSSAHNQALAQALGQLQQRLHVNITVVDMSAAFQDIVAHPAKYGVDPATLTDPCIQSPSCVANHANYLFWDGVHPTGFVQQQLADFFFSSLDGPTTVGPEIELDKMVQQDLFDHVSARTAALRIGVAGLTIDGAAGMPALADADKPLAAFVTDSYGWGARDARQDTVGFDYRRNATSAGLDYRLNDWAAVGGLIGYSEANDRLADSLGSQSVDSYQVAVYGAAYADGWYGSAAGTYAYDDWTRIDRNVFVAGQTARASTNGHTLGAKFEGGYVLRSGDWSFGPEIEMRLAEYRVGGYAEQGAVGLNQAVDTQNATSLVGQFGFEAAVTTSIGDYAVVPRLSVAWDRELHGGARAIITRIASQPETSVTTDIGPGATGWVRLDAGVDVKLTDIFSALIDFDSTVGRDGGEDYSALARLKASF